MDNLFGFGQDILQFRLRAEPRLLFFLITKDQHLISLLSWSDVMCQIFKCGMTTWLGNALAAEGLRTVEDFKASRSIAADAAIALGRRETSLSWERHKPTAKEKWQAALKVSQVSL